ncbi:MAG: 4-hydroxy-3-methylbut-2-enyl diphosphate reductase, partial [Treponema sp.]|nr:4-hydroxy-3-methylbut-2-enyl diphosphate reductase [Treponema sp.]
MKVIRAGVLGFCMGVRRAVELACAEVKKTGRVFTLGPLVHNPRVLETLQGRGVEIIDENRIPRNMKGVSFIRAEGYNTQGVCGALAQMIKKMHNFVHFLPCRLPKEPKNRGFLRSKAA